MTAITQISILMFFVSTEEGVYMWNFILGWNHPCLWLNASYCLHVFAEMEFHPRMKDRDEISSRDEKKKKRHVNTSSGDEILKQACFFYFWRMYSSMFSNFNMFEHSKSMSIMKLKAFLWKGKPEKKKDEHNYLFYFYYFLCEV